MQARHMPPKRELMRIARRRLLRKSVRSSGPPSKANVNAAVHDTTRCDAATGDIPEERSPANAEAAIDLQRSRERS
jgi:hypothetical protein